MTPEVKWTRNSRHSCRVQEILLWINYYQQQRSLHIPFVPKNQLVIWLFHDFHNKLLRDSAWYMGASKNALQFCCTSLQLSEESWRLALDTIKKACVSHSSLWPTWHHGEGPHRNEIVSWPPAVVCPTFVLYCIGSMCNIQPCAVVWHVLVCDEHCWRLGSTSAWGSENKEPFCNYIINKESALIDEHPSDSAVSDHSSTSYNWCIFSWPMHFLVIQWPVGLL